MPSGRLVALAMLALSSPVLSAQSLPFLPSGDAWLRSDVEALRDDGEIGVSTTWPLPTRDLPEAQRETLRSSMQPGSATDAGWFVDGAAKPTRLRVYDQTPRENGEAGVQGAWAAGDYAGGVMRLSYAIKPQDEMHYRVDDSYASWRFGNWWVTLGAQERWWGPGWDGSLLMSNNARPMPGIALDRVSAVPPDFFLLQWLGPWRLTTFIDRMEDRRADFGKTLVFGGRFTFSPTRNLEIGLSRTAQFCGHTRPCGVHTFFDMLTARKNAVVNESGPNPDINSKPAGNHAAIDVRWHLGNSPLAVYWQEDGEVFDSGNYRPRQTLQLIGMEYGGKQVAGGHYRAFVEFADTACGGVGISRSEKPAFGCAYEKDTYPAGYNYRGRVIGDAMDRDGRRYTFGQVWKDSADRAWDLRVRYVELNRGAISQIGLTPHTVSTLPQNLWEVSSQMESHFRGFSYAIGASLDRTNTETEGRWTTGWRPSAFLTIERPW